MRISKTSKKIGALAAASSIFSLVIVVSGITDAFELKAFDLLSRHLNPERSSGDIIIVQIDQQSIDALSREGITWPWPRQVYAPIVEYLSEADAVFLDLLFTESSSYGHKDDLILSEAIRKTSNVYLPVFLTNTEKALSGEEAEFVKNAAIKEEIPAGLSFNSAITPIGSLMSSVKGTGNVTIPPDEDGVYRKIPIFFKLREHTIPHFIIGYLLSRGIVEIRKGSLYAGETLIPLKANRLMIRYFRGKNPFPAIPAVDILRSYQESSASKPAAVKKDFFRGKKVFIGQTAAGLYDLKPTSVSSVSTGALIHAATLDNLINKNFIRPASRIYSSLFILLICFFISFSVIKYHRLLINIFVFAVSLSAALLIPVILFSNALYMDIIPPAMSLIISFIFATSYSYATEGRERRFVRRVFSQYMDKTIVEHLLKNPKLIRPGGQRKRVTVFFADIAGFTSIAESLSAEETARVLHTTLNLFTEIIIRNRGVIDKYIGDCIMAFWGAPIGTDKDEADACHAALQCADSVEDINRGFRAEGLPEISVRIGLHSGDAIVGNLGSDRLFDYTVVGDTVNLASRLESANKFFKTVIIVSGETLDRTGELFFARELGRIEVKGKTIPADIFELVSEYDKIEQREKDIVTLFNGGMALVKENRPKEALMVFEDIHRRYPDDGPADFYREKIESGDISGLIRMKVK